MYAVPFFSLQVIASSAISRTSSSSNRAVMPSLPARGEFTESPPTRATYWKWTSIVAVSQGTLPRRFEIDAKTVAVREQEFGFTRTPQTRTIQQTGTKSGRQAIRTNQRKNSLADFFNSRRQNRQPVFRREHGQARFASIAERRARSTGKWDCGRSLPRSKKLPLLTSHFSRGLPTITVSGWGFTNPPLSGRGEPGLKVRFSTGIAWADDRYGGVAPQGSGGFSRRKDLAMV